MPDLSDTGCVFDFDGTCTYPLNDRGDGPFCTAWSQNFPRITKLRITPGEAQAFCRSVYAENHAQPEQFAWNRDGYNVCPLSDPLLLVSEVGLRIFDHFGHLVGENSQRQQVLDQVYLASYPSAKHVLRAEAPIVFNLLREHGAQIGVLTNSDPARVRKIITEECQRLGMPGSLDWLLPFVHGFAQKGTVTPDDPPDMRSMKRIPGLRRPILLRRGHAIAVLKKMAGSKKRVIVFDDIPELGLHYAEELGHETVLVANEETPRYEVDYYSSDSPRRYCIRDLNDAPAIVFGS